MNDLDTRSERELLDLLIEALGSEIEHVQKEGAGRALELLSGERVQTEPSVYVFFLEDPTRLPEDAAGTLRCLNRVFSASIASQEGNRITLKVDGLDLPDFIPRASLSVDSVQLLIQLRERMEDVREGRVEPGLLSTVLGFQKSRVGWGTIPTRIASELDLDAAKKTAVEQGLGSDIMMLWGPPGTGKTFTIAALTAALFERGETVLIVSHTHAAVDQALWETIESKRGILRSLPNEQEGCLLKVGDVRRDEIPDTVCFDRIVQRKAGKIDLEIEVLTEQAAQAESQLMALRENLSTWERQDGLHQEIADYEARIADSQENESQLEEELRGCRSRLAQALQADIDFWKQELGDAEAKLRRLEAASDAQRDDLGQARLEYDLARRSRWPWKQGRIRKAHEEVLHQITAAEDGERSVNDAAIELEKRTPRLKQASECLADARDDLSNWMTHRWDFDPSSSVLTAATTLMDNAKALKEVQETHQACLPRLRDARETLEEVNLAVQSIAPRFALNRSVSELGSSLAELRSAIETLDNRRAAIGAEVLAGARILFATMTKMYIDRDLRKTTHDAVIIDESSMAMLPLVAFAATRARRRVIIVGDFYQLSPIVQSPDAQSVLSQSIFDLWRIPERVEGDEQVDELKKLDMQRRMHPEIANVARDLLYKDRLRDHSTVYGREIPDWIESALPSGSSLLAVDISGLRPWSSRVPGGSRFNLYSAEVSCEIAARFAKHVGEPSSTDSPPIGIVTPYAAQRRFISRMVNELGLERWVLAGTVHTFQGNESDVVIFDSVLADPFWSARLVNPRQTKEVLRDLNVAVTRAKHQLIFIGDFTWLREHAGKSENAMGHLWTHLEERATLLKAEQLIGPDFLKTVASWPGVVKGWSLEEAPEGSSFLTEQSFYPTFLRDLASAKERVILFTPFIGKTRWPYVEPAIRSAAERGVEIFLMHKPLFDPEWQTNRQFGEQVLSRLRDYGVKLVGVSGIHAKTIVVDESIVYEGSLNWASQVASREHMWRFQSTKMVGVVEKLYQLQPIVETFSSPGADWKCPNCGSDLIVVNQRDLKYFDREPLKFGCSLHAADKTRCEGHLRPVSARAPFATIPTCEQRQPMTLSITKSGRPGSWQCPHKGCKRIRWRRGDPVPEAASAELQGHGSILRH